VLLLLLLGRLLLLLLLSRLLWRQVCCKIFLGCEDVGATVEVQHAYRPQVQLVPAAAAATAASHSTGDSR
jgi:hypothetical protein